MQLGRIKQRLLAQADYPRQNLNRVLGGACLFFLGVALVYFAEYYLAPGLTQELTALAGLLFGGAGAILAAIGYLSLSLLRIIKFIDDEHDNDSRTPPRH